jgi:transcriptional regulator with XRE-family HTH domain
MLSKKELLKTPNYLLTKYQNEIYRQLISFMESNNLTQKEVAQKLGVSGSYISQVLNGNFNFTLKKLIELGLMIGKVPYFEFVELDEFWIREKEAITVSQTISLNLSSLNISIEPIHYKNYSILSKRAFTQELSSKNQEIPLDQLECCAN